MAQIEGLEGLEFVGYRPPKKDEFCVHIFGIHQAQTDASEYNPELILQPAEGWEIKFDIQSNCWVPVKKFDGPMTLRASFVCADGIEMAAARKKITQLGGKVEDA